jgi:DNA-binding transcriptional LysR family regulator
VDTRFLETFFAVARGGSYAAAAQQLGLTANAVAQRLQALEDEFGAPLVVRSGRTVRPTEAGHAVLAKMPGFFDELRGLREAVAGQATQGELRIGAIATALTGILPAVLERLTREHPGLRIFLEPGTSSALYDRTLGGALDAAAIVRPAFNWPKGVAFRQWQREPLILLVPEAEVRTDVREILSTRPLILYDRQQWGGRQAAAWLHEQHLETEIRFELDALDAIAVLVARGLGVSVVPDWIGPRPAGIRLRRLELPGPVPERVIGLLYPRNGVRMHLLRVLLDSVETS